MSRSEYRERQRQQDLSDTHTLDGGEDASTLGFSLGSVQSAPALGGLGAGLNGNSGGGGGGGLGGGGGRKAFSGGGDGGGRGTSITAFENVNPFAGGVRVATSTPKRVTGEGRTVAATATGGDLSPLSASVGGQSGGMFGFGAGPESSSVGEESDDLHLALVKVGRFLPSRQRETVQDRKSRTKHFRWNRAALPYDRRYESRRHERELLG